MKAKRVEIVADRHIHAGKEYRKGEIIELPESSAEWLVEAGAAEYARAPRAEKPRNRKGD